MCNEERRVGKSQRASVPDKDDRSEIPKDQRHGIKKAKGREFMMSTQAERLVTRSFVLVVVVVIIAGLLVSPARAGDRAQVWSYSYDGCSWELVWNTRVISPPWAQTHDKTGGCRYQKVIGWDNDEYHRHGYTSTNPATVYFNDKGNKTIVGWVITWEHEWEQTSGNKSVSG